MSNLLIIINGAARSCVQAPEFLTTLPYHLTIKSEAKDFSSLRENLIGYRETMQTEAVTWKLANYVILH